MSLAWKDISTTVGASAPLLGTLLGGPAGGAIGGLIAAALGTGGTAGEVAQALSTNPDAAVKLKQIEADKQIKLQEMLLDHGTSELAIAAGDRKDARLMQTVERSHLPATLALLITAGFFGILATMVLGTWHASENNALLILLGSLGTSFGAIINFYFGSSAGSARKDELLANSSPANQG